MSIEKMKLVKITGHKKNLGTVLNECFAGSDFHPEHLTGRSDGHGYRQFAEENPYQPKLERLKELADTYGIELKLLTDHSVQNETELGEHLMAFADRLANLNAQRHLLLGAKEHAEAALAQLDHMESLDVNLDDIFACKYLDVRFGRMPLDSAAKLRYYEDRMFFYQPLSVDEEYQWCFYFTNPIHAAEIDDIFLSLYFERIWIPEDIHGVPGQTQSYLKVAVEAADTELQAISDLIREESEQNHDLLMTYYTTLTELNRTFELHRYVSVYRDSFILVGFMPEKSAENLRQRLCNLDELAIEINAHDSDPRFKAPTKLKNNFISRPFELFVDMYGTPGYNELDPTPFVAGTYILLYGIMFGDLGQGLVIALLGLFLSRVKGMEFGKILTRIGCSAAVFGVLYGSVFGLEHLLDPFYINVLGMPGKPIHVMDPLTINNLLIAAISLGVVMIIAAMLLNIGIGIKHRDWEKAIFSNNGLAGLTFYLAVLIGAVAKLTGGPNLFTAPYILGFIVLPILIIFLKHPLGKLSRGSKHFMPEEGIGSFVVEGIFELFEVVLSFVTNTLSFLRVGGFIISHAGMMAVVMTLTEMMTGAGSIAALVIGNIFVMALEGFIVGIQALRLEFYELFSRYYEAQGKPFCPVTANAAE